MGWLLNLFAERLDPWYTFRLGQATRNSSSTLPDQRRRADTPSQGPYRPQACVGSPMDERSGCKTKEGDVWQLSV